MSKKPFPCPDCARSFRTEGALSDHRADTHGNPNWEAGKVKCRKLTVPTCPMCGEPAALSNGKHGIKAECCGLWSWGMKPLVSRGTHRARIQAHEVFDRIWKGGDLDRGECYRRLALLMGMTRAECHISHMDYDQASRVVEIIQAGALLQETVAA